MLRGVTVSVLVHASVLAMAVLSWPHQKTDCDRMIERLQKEEPGLSPVDVLMRIPQCASSIDVPIEFLDIGLVSDIAPTVKAEKPKEEEIVPEEELQEEEPDKVLQEESAPEEEEVIIPDETAKPEAAPKKEEPKKEPPKEDKKLIEKQKPKKADDLDFLNDFEDILKDKAKTDRKQPRETEPPPTDRPVLKDAQEERKGAGERRGNTASLQAAMKRYISVCWIGVSDQPVEYQFNVVVAMSLDSSGKLKGDLKLIEPRSRPVGRGGVTVERAMDAVRQCAPYKLPPDDYEQWKDIQVTIGPDNG